MNSIHTLPPYFFIIISFHLRVDITVGFSPSGFPTRRIHPSPRPVSYRGELLTYGSTPKLEDHSLSAVCDSFFNMFSASFS